MRLARLLSSTVVIGVAVGATILACGGDDAGGGNGSGSGSNNNPDAFVFMDAPSPDATATTGIGQPCTPSQDGSGQGTCPAGYTCLPLLDGSGPWCSRPCVEGSGDECGSGYTGPGRARCLWDITFGGDPTVYEFCGVMCADNTGTCGPDCDGTCPGSMVCTAPLGSAGSACK